MADFNEISTVSNGGSQRAFVELLRPELHGGRFDSGGGLPLTALKDVAGLQRLLVETAKWYLRQRAGDFGQPVPRGFERSFQLNLSSIEIGSAKLVISVSNAQRVLPGIAPPHLDALQEAAEIVLDTVGAVGNGHEPAPLLPSQCLQLFAPLGRLVQGDEYIEISTPTTSGTKIYDQRAHDRIMELVSDDTSSSPVQLRAAVPEVDQFRMRFEMHPIGYRSLVNLIPVSHYSTIMEAFNGYQDGKRILVDAAGRYNRRGNLIGLDAVHDIKILDPLDVQTRLTEIALLRDGWLEGDGVAPKPDGLSWLAGRLQEHYPSDLPLPYLYPTYFGGVQAEWTIGSFELTLEFDLGARSAEWCAINVVDSTAEEHSFGLDESTGWNRLVAALQRFIGAAGETAVG